MSERYCGRVGAWIDFAVGAPCPECGDEDGHRRLVVENVQHNLVSNEALRVLADPKADPNSVDWTEAGIARELLEARDRIRHLRAILQASRERITEAWHEGAYDKSLSLADVLGMSRAEYEVWVGEAD